MQFPGHGPRWQHAPDLNRVPKHYFALAIGIGMSEFQMSHWVFHFPFSLFATPIHLPWSICLPSAPETANVPVA